MIYEKIDDNTIVRVSELKQQFRRDELVELQIKVEEKLAEIKELIVEMDK